MFSCIQITGKSALQKIQCVVLVFPQISSQGDDSFAGDFCEQMDVLKLQDGIEKNCIVV